MTDDAFIPRPVAKISEGLVRVETKLDNVTDALVRIEKRLDEGDKDFDVLKARIDCVESDKAKVIGGWKVITVVGALAAALGAALLKVASLAIALSGAPR